MDSQEPISVECKEKYFLSLRERLSKSAFRLIDDTLPGNYKTCLIAVITKLEASKFGEATRFVIGTTVDSINSQGFYEYSSLCMKYALEHRDSLLPRGFGGSLFCFPVVLSSNISEDLKLIVTKTLAPKHWVAFEFPVLASLQDQKLYYCTRTSIYGAAYYGGFRRFANEMLGF